MALSHEDGKRLLALAGIEEGVDPDWISHFATLALIAAKHSHDASVQDAQKGASTTDRRSVLKKLQKHLAASLQLLGNPSIHDDLSGNWIRARITRLNAESDPPVSQDLTDPTLSAQSRVYRLMRQAPFLHEPLRGGRPIDLAEECLERAVETVEELLRVAEATILYPHQKALATTTTLKLARLWHSMTGEPPRWQRDRATGEALATPFTTFAADFLYTLDGWDSHDEYLRIATNAAANYPLSYKLST